MEEGSRWRAWARAALEEALTTAAYCWCCAFPACCSWELPDARYDRPDRYDRCAREAERGIRDLERYLQDTVA
jgi:hypothetical protein